MSWVVVGFFLFVSSVALYLTVRKAQVSRMPNQTQNLAMFAVPPIFYLGAILFTRQSLVISLRDLAIVFLVALFLSYLGNVFSLEGVSLASNPGYSLMISKSYVVFTTFVAVLIFNSELTVKSALAIVLIVISSVLISIPNQTNKTSSKSLLWLFYSIGAFFCWGTLALVSKYVLGTGLSVFVYLFYLTLFVTLFIFTEIRLRRVSIRFHKSELAIFIAIGGLATVFNLSMQTGYLLAPNPGYINAVNASSISLLTLLSVYFFKDEFSLRKFLGVIGATLGLVFLFF